MPSQRGTAPGRGHSRGDQPGRGQHNPTHDTPRDVKEACELDRQNGNTFWADAIQCELNQLFEYDTFHHKGQLQKTPNGYQPIRCHFVFDVKQSGKHKAHFVAGSHMMNPAKDSVYSDVFGLRSLCIISFLAELNGHELMAADVRNTYLEACTKEKVCFIAVPEFGALAGHTFVIHKALYGLCNSGALIV